MNQEAATQLEKILALADSDQPGEALGALRKARQMLEREGLSFGELARSAQRARFGLNLPFFSGQQVAQLESHVMKLELKLEQLQDEKSNQQAQIDFWRRRAMDLEQQLSISAADSQRWRQMARETIEKLWDINQKTTAEEFTSSAPAAESRSPRRAVGS